jgi:hypothetical protein
MSSQTGLRTVDWLDRLHQEAVRFVDAHYPNIGNDQKDRKITILATINQLIELEKLANRKPS